jgi:hypothetical protein
MVAKKPPPTCKAADGAVEAALSDARVLLSLCEVEGDWKDWDSRYASERWDASDQIERGQLSDEVKAYLLELVGRDLGDPRYDRPLPRGRRRNGIRDSWIVRAIATLVNAGMRPTRNRQLGRNKTADCPSACAIVAQLLGERKILISERGIEEIWRRRKAIRAARP